ncbi:MULTISPECIES: hypothetical protein [unclassified Pseudomonas]|uniref:hypothetical protein n=1 Tax=unclassified Pseudomonas TaxID=196821 RepID=UPI000482B4B3|nr:MULTISPECIES: hypothetical protein [unclassified Pseudomonas]RAS32777.1 hypothetical protein H040_00533 [Pseudomonas sp. URMO17WK12:I7]SME99066.1 hypothetical protein SAMN02745903_00764 [Pseudomonas sp. URMO17WK12:I5]
MIPSADYPVIDTQSRSGVSWAAIFAGAAAAAALSMILVVLGAGLGFAATSPWANEGASAKALGVSTIIWLLLTQIIASGLGGYLAGRLRVKWANLHGDEVYFRDTAHGFLSWAVSTLVAAMLVLGTAGNLVGAGASAATQTVGMTVAAGGAAAANADKNSMGYFVDSLFRGDGPAPVSDDAANGVAARILAKGLAGDGTLAPEDRTYLAQLVAQRTRLTQAEAEARVDQVIAQVQQLKLQAKQAADTAAKVAAWMALWTFVALLCGAFFASLAALYGGRRRDHVQWVEGEYVAHRTVQR